jgi:putative solute:sodium symporter small subunit
MIEDKERTPHWRHTEWQALASLIPFLAIVVVLPLYAEQLNSRNVLLFPLGYFLAAHGVFVIAVVTHATFINRQNAIDHWHGAHEDE